VEQHTKQHVAQARTAQPYTRVNAKESGQLVDTTQRETPAPRDDAEETSNSIKFNVCVNRNRWGTVSITVYIATAISGSTHCSDL
jgi:hypothetical protein